MSLANAGSFLVVASLRNRILRQVRRMRSPRYLIATSAGFFYLWSIFIRRMGSGSSGRLSPNHLPLAEAFLLALFFAQVLYAWLFGGDEGTLTFTETEIQFLFPAPATRRSLLHYRLCRILVVTFYSSLVTTLFVGLRLTSHWGFFILGAWMGLATLGLHLNAASLTRASLAQHGVRGGARRVAVSLVALLGTLALIYAVRQVAPPSVEELTPGGLSAWVAKALATAPLSWVLLPFDASVRVALSQDWHTVAAGAPVALAILGLHYAWVLSTQVEFEDASVDAAARKLARVTALRSGRGITLRKGKPPFQLAGIGAPAVGIYWKNLTASTRMISLRFILVLSIFTAAGIVLAFQLSGASWVERASALGMVSFGAAAYVALLGGQLIRSDFRLDLTKMEVLKTWPVRSSSLVMATVLAPATALAAFEWAALILGGGLVSLALPGWLPRSAFVPALAATLLLLPALTTCQLIVQNTSVLLFPSWISTDPNAQRGIEAMGQRLLTLVGTLLVLAFGLVPAALLALPAGWLLWAPLRWNILPVVAAIAVGGLALEASLVFRLMGRLFERFDVGEA